MMLWLALTAMISAAAVVLSAPFIRGRERARLQTAANLAVYRDQLREVDAELAQGLIDGSQAESASTEIKRRILAADRSEEASATALSRPERNFAVTAVSAIVVFGSILLYVVVGNPDLPSAAPSQSTSDQGPVAATAATTPAVPAASPVASSQRKVATADQPAAPSGQGQTGLPPVEEMAQRLQARLQRNPADADGWRMLGWSYFSIDRFTDAADAYAKAIELRPTSADYRSAHGEALVRSADGVVTADAKADFEQALRLDPKDARARFFIGLAKEQAGDKQAALSDWKDLLATADPSEPWLPDLKQRIAEMSRPPGVASPAPSAASPDLSVTALQDFLRAEKAKQQAAEPSKRGPTADDIRNADNMAPKDRTAMIRSMVEGLASRLEQSPADAEGWIKLIRSRVVLGETEQASQSLQRALAQFGADAPERKRILDEARQLGLAQ